MKTKKYFSVTRGDAGACFPEIPEIEDILHFLDIRHSSESQRRLAFCLYNAPDYNKDVERVADEVRSAVAGLDVEAAKKIIARTIISFTDPRDRCLFEPAIAEATLILCGVMPEARDDLRRACACPKCRKIAQEEGLL